MGGNKVLLEDEGTRLFFDFGTTFAIRELYFEEYLKPRSGAGLLDLLEMELLPPLEGLYRPDLVPSGEVWDRCRGRRGCRELDGVDGVLVSHAHVDHTGYISFLKEDIPVYGSAMTAFIAKAMQDSAMADFEKEVCYISPREDRDGYLGVARESYRQRPFCFADRATLNLDAHEFWERSPKHILGDTNLKRKRLKKALIAPAAGQVGKLPALFLPVDHSIYGSGAWAVETSAGWVVYTGDVREHGSGAKDTQRFIDTAASLHPTVMICEGTRAPASEGRDEARATDSYRERDVYERALQHVVGEKRLVIADFGPRNIERLEAFLAIAGQTGRQLVVPAKDAYLLEAMRLVSPAVPGLSNCPGLLVYEDLRYRLDPWEQNLRQQFGNRLVSPRQVHNSPGDYILCFSFWDAKNLIDINTRGGLYVYSSSEAYTEEQEMDFARLRNWLAHFEMNSVGLPRRKGQSPAGLPEEERGLHASGHASASDLLRMVREIGPRTLVPVHTENPRFMAEALRDTTIQVKVLEYAERWEF